MLCCAKLPMVFVSISWQPSALRCISQGLKSISIWRFPSWWKANTPTHQIIVKICIWLEANVTIRVIEMTLQYCVYFQRCIPFVFIIVMEKEQGFRHTWTHKFIFSGTIWISHITNYFVSCSFVDHCTLISAANMLDICTLHGGWR